MTNVPISTLPAAIAVGPTSDYLELSQYTGIPGALYRSVKVTPQQVSSTFANQVPTGVEYVISNQGSVLLTGVQPFITMPYTATITAAYLVASPTGSVTVDIWRCTYSQFDGGVTHPTVGDSICGGNPLVLSGGTKTQSTLSGWATTLNIGDVLAFNISSVSSSTQATIVLYLNRVLGS